MHLKGANFLWPSITKIRNARFTSSIISWSKAILPQFTQRQFFVPDSKVTRSKKTPQPAPLEKLVNKALQVGSSYKKYHLNSSLKNEAQASSLMSNKPIANDPGKSLQSTGFSDSFIYENATDSKCVGPLLSVMFAQECPFYVPSATVAFFSKPKYKVQVQIGICCNQLYSNDFLLYIGAGLKIASKTFLREEWPAKIRYQAVPKLHGFLEQFFSRTY